jgi:hypothetical protein
MRSTVAQLVALGQLPSEHGADVHTVQEFEQALQKIEPPLTREEALALLPTFGKDGCFGLAWSLIHLIESAPGWPYSEAKFQAENPWVEAMLERAN